MGLFPGAVLGAFIITIGNELLRSVGEYRLLVLGVTVLISVLFLPNGLISAVCQEPSGPQTCTHQVTRSMRPHRGPRVITVTEGTIAVPPNVS